MLVVEISRLFKRHVYSTVLRSCWPNLKLKIFTPFYRTRPKSPVYASNRLSLPLSTILKSLFSRRGQNESVCKMCTNENCTCKACVTIVFHCQICKFVTFLLQSSSWLRKLPNEKYKLYRNKILPFTHQSKKLYYFTHFSNHINNMKKTWA